MKYPRASVESAEATDNFLNEASDTIQGTSNQNLKATGNAESVRASGHRSMRERESGIRESLGYAMKTKYGESVRDDTDDDDVDPADKHLSTRQRMSKKIGALSPCEVAFTIFKAFVGLGILSTPYFAYETGWILSPFLMLASLCLTLYCVKLLIECADELGKDSMPSIAEETWGRWLKIVTDMCIIGSQLGFCCSYVFFIASQVGAVINCIVLPNGLSITSCSNPDEMNSGGNALFSKWWFLAFFYAVYIPLVWIRKTEKLAWTHLMSDVIIVFVILTCLVFGGKIAVERDHNQDLKSMGFMGVQGLGVGVSSAVYAFEGIAVILPVRDIAADKVGYFKLISCVILGIAIFYIFFGQYCLWAYGPASIGANTYITVSLPATSVWTYIAKLAYCFTLVFTYPLQMFPASNVIESYIVGGWPKSSKRMWCKNLSRTIVISITLFIALVVWERVGVFLELLGAITCAPLAFALPAMYHIKVAKTKTQKYIDITIVCVSLFLTVFCTVIATQEWIDFQPTPTD